MAHFGGFESLMDYRTEAPPILRDFLVYHETIQGHSHRTVDEYYLDLRNFFRFLKQNKNLVSQNAPLDDISIADVDLPLVRDVTLTDIYSYMNYLSRDRGLNNTSRARKVATIRSFYKYLTNKAKLLETNPVQDFAQIEEISAKILKFRGKYGPFGQCRR